MNRKVSVGITASLVLIAITITFTATMILSMNMFDRKVDSSTQREGIYDKASEIDKIIKSKYYTDVNESELYDSLINGYVEGLGDPDTVYLTPEDLAMREQLSRGTIVSIGIDVVDHPSGYIAISHVRPESSAKMAGLEVGDVIKQIDDVDTYGMSVEEAEQMLIGTEGNSISLIYSRQEIDASSSVELTSTVPFARIEVSGITTSRVENVYYINVSSMWESVPADFARAAREAEMAYQANEARGLVIDIRDLNGGYNIGLIAEMLDILMPTGTTISGVYRDGETKVVYTSDANFLKVPIVVLVNKNTKGYSEMFAAVLASLPTCRLVGNTTYGKGTLQELIRLSDGSAIDVSVALLKPPSGDIFHEKGVIPDFDVKAPEDFIVTAGDPDSFKDPQFNKALEVLHSFL